MSPKKCIFCGGGGTGFKITNEHIWSDWMTKKGLVPLSATNRATLETFRRQHAPYGEVQTRIRPGSTAQRKVRRVCERCNSTWMSGLEAEVQPLLIPLIEARDCIVGPEARAKIAQWVAMKVFVIEHLRLFDEKAILPVYDQAARQEFKETWRVPPMLGVWAADGDGPAWRTKLRRFGGGIYYASSPLDEPPPMNTVQSVTWGMGRLRLHVVATTDTRFFGAGKWEFDTSIVQLWPIDDSADIVWPRAQSLSDAQMDEMADVLQAVLEKNYGRRQPPHAAARPS